MYPQDIAAKRHDIAANMFGLEVERLCKRGDAKLGSVRIMPM
jgi:hypothetical protein